jgi:hypothetical protein
MTSSLLLLFANVGKMWVSYRILTGITICDRMSMDAEKSRGEIGMFQRTVGQGNVPEIVLLCSFCGRLRNDAGGWEQVNKFIQKHPHAYLSHGICPKCAQLQFPDEYAAIRLDKEGNEAKESAVIV